MKILLLIGSIVLVLGLLIAGATTSIFAHGPEDDATLNEGAWQTMHEACENGDWEKMAKAAEEVHGEGGMGDHMGGGMMDGGWGGHMGRGMMGW